MSQKNLKNNLIPLTLARGLRFRIDEKGHIYASLSTSSGEFYVAPEIFTLLRLLPKVTSNAETLQTARALKNEFTFVGQQLPSQNECNAILQDLIGAGIVIPGDQDSSKHMHQDGFGDPWIQWAMISDSKRFYAYYNALKHSITNSSKVLDIGSGSGLLSAQALELGAEKVIAIEETQTAEKIKPILKKARISINSKNFIIHNRNSFDVEIKDKIDIVVSELFGNDPFQEGILTTLREIGSRFIGQNVTYIPQSLQVYFSVIDLSHEHPISHRLLALTKAKSNLKNESLESRFLNSAGEVLDLEATSFPISLAKNDFTPLSKNIELGQCKLNPPPIFNKDKSKHPFFGRKKFNILNNSKLPVGVLWFRSQLTDSVSLSSFVLEDDSCAHWCPIAIPLHQFLNKNDEIEISYELSEHENFLNCTIFQNKKTIGSR